MFAPRRRVRRCEESGVVEVAVMMMMMDIFPDLTGNVKPT